MNEQPILVRVVAPHFVAGMEFTEGVCTSAAPILKWAIGKRASEVGAYFRRKQWTAQPMTGVCFCLRPASFGYSPRPTAKIAWACSPEHATINEKLFGKENALSEQEAQARQEAGKLAGEYLDHLNKTDLAVLSPEEFDTLILTVIETYRDAMTKACEPF